MSIEKWPPIDPGTEVKTTQPNLEKRGEWTDEGWASKKWGVQGTVITHHDSHGLCYDVRHEDGSQGCYDPSELEIAETYEQGINLDELQEETEKLKTPEEWQDVFHVTIRSADGWRAPDAPPWDQPITREEFLQRLTSCTVDLSEYISGRRDWSLLK